MRIVLALGGNALLTRGETPDAARQRGHLRTAVRAIAEVSADHELLIVHGNGPQVGLLANESEADRSLSAPYPLGDLVAESQGLIGSWIQQELLNQGCPSVALITQVLVDADDPSFDAPTKPIGPLYDKATAHRLAREHGWVVAPDTDGWRRVVASPPPQTVFGLGTAIRLIASGQAVILGGGGGIALSRQDDSERSTFVPVEAVIDKDRAAGLIAASVGAGALIILTDVPGVMTDYGTPRQTLITRATPRTFFGYDFPAGSMGPKVTACCDFVESGPGRRAAIGALGSLAEVLAGTAGTQIHRS